MARQYFGTDGVRGVVGETLTADLVERLGKAAALRCERGRVFVGRDTRGSGPELEEAFAEGVASAGGTAVLGGVLPTPAVALLRLDLAAVISASHNPPEYNGVKFFDRDGRKLTDAAEEEIEALLDAPVSGGGEIDRVEVAADSYLEHVLEGFGTDLTGLRIAVDCANGAYAGLAPQAFRQLGAEVTAIGDAPDGTNINVGCGATDLRALAGVVRDGGFDLGIAFDGDGDRMLAVDERGEPVNGDQILAVLALDLGVDAVAVTTMTNLGFHRLMDERGIRVVVTDVGDRYVLEALQREGMRLGGEQSGPPHLAPRPRDRRRPGRRAPPLSRARRWSPLRVGRRDAAFPAGDAEPAAHRARPASRRASGRRRRRQRGARRRGTRSRAAVRHRTGRACARGGRDAGGRGGALC